jgi:hypothetical protein
MPRKFTPRAAARRDGFPDFQEFDNKKLSRHADGLRDRFIPAQSQSLQRNEFFSMAWMLHREL